MRSAHPMVTAANTFAICVCSKYPYGSGRLALISTLEIAV
jgi:hypothetical protein